MGDFPPRWEWVRDLPEGGQAHTFVVRLADKSNEREYVLKRLKNPKRDGYFEREIKACETLDHPNVLRVLEHGFTPKGKPFLITEYCEGESLQKKGPLFTDPGDGLRFFRAIVGGVAYAHAQPEPIYHLDLKPENIFLKNGSPIVGDFGICVIEDGEVSFTGEGPRGSMYYCAPELRNPKLAGGIELARGDVYSLGKVLYWLFTKDIRDGHEDEYSDVAERKLAMLFSGNPQFTFVDELISGAVRRNPESRFGSAVEFESCVQDVIDRIDAGGHVLDLRLPLRCRFCGRGTYEAVVMPPLREKRLGEQDSGPHTYEPRDVWEHMASQTSNTLGQAFSSRQTKLPVPINLVCNYCGNLQHFRLDRGQANKNWLP